LSRNVDLNILLVYRSPFRPSLFLYLSVVLYLPAQHIPLNCTTALCTLVTVWLRLFHINFPFLRSLTANCHLPFGGLSFRRSSVPLTVLRHEFATQYRLQVSLVRTLVRPPPPSGSFLFDPKYFTVP
jgi:hypothetical protein